MMKKVWTYIYFIWLSVNIGVMAYFMTIPSEEASSDSLGLDLDLELGGGLIHQEVLDKVVEGMKGVVEVVIKG